MARYVESGAHNQPQFLEYLQQALDMRLHRQLEALANLVPQGSMPVVPPLVNAMHYADRVSPALLERLGVITAGHLRESCPEVGAHRIDPEILSDSNPWCNSQAQNSTNNQPVFEESRVCRKQIVLYKATSSVVFRPRPRRQRGRRDAAPAGRPRDLAFCPT